MRNINSPFLRTEPAQWITLVLLSALLISILKYAQLPAAILLGSMVSGIIISIKGGTIRVPRLYFYFSQAVIGCLIAEMIIIDIFADLLRQWPMFLGIISAILLASYALGFGISKCNLLHHTTAFWGLLPGGSSVMILMADAFGADSRLVAFMQYIRVLLVAITASLMVHFWMQIPHTPEAIMPWFPHIHWHVFGVSLGLIALGIGVAHFSTIPAGAILVPLVIGSFLHLSGVIELELPPWLLVIAYILLGWTIGMRFTQRTLSHAMTALPQTLFAVITLMLFCGFLAYLLVIYWNIDPLTAYLATSPGGMDSMAIIAASTHADMPFVMALQSMRFLIILILGPPISRWLAKQFDLHPETSIPVEVKAHVRQNSKGQHLPLE